MSFLIQGGDGLDIHSLRHMNKRVGRAWRQTGPLLDKLVGKSVEFLEVGRRDVMDSQEEANRGKKTDG